MAIDWNREITFTGRGKGSADQGAGYPEKTHMNLMAPARKAPNAARVVPAALVAAVLVALFAKFGVVDFYAQVGAKQAELAAQRQALDSLTSQLARYDEVLEEYEGYASAAAVGGGLSVDALDALSLVDRIVAPSARVASVSLAGDTLSLNVTGVTLDGVGRLVSELRAQDLVDDVSVSTAATQDSDSEDVAAALTIALATGR